VEQTLTEDGAWCWFQDPRAVCVRQRFRRTYATWITRRGTLEIGAFDHDTQQTVVRELKTAWGADDHGSGSLLVLPDNRLMIFYAQHNGTGLYCRATTAPEDISEWDAETAVSLAPRITYSNPVYLRDEKLIHVFWRGTDWKPAFATSADGKTWSPPRTLLRDAARQGNAVRPYVKVASDGRSAIHVAFTDSHPRDEPRNAIHYLRYERHAFHAADGSLLGSGDALPIEHGGAALVFDGTKHGVRSWLWDVAHDSNGHPVIAYTRLPANDDHRYHYARWDGGQWIDTEMTPGGSWFPQTRFLMREREPHYSGGMALDHADPSIVYLSRRVDDTFEIERWVTADRGVTWAATPITRASRHNNVRPVVPRGSDGLGHHVLWMHGRYVHYTNFRTGIRLNFQPGN
jgi:BNR repeat-containing family member